MDDSQALAKLDFARQALAEVRTISDVKLIRDQAQAIQNLLKQQQYSFESQNYAAEIKLRAERRLGEMLVEMEKNPGGNPNLLHDATGLPPTLQDLGIEKTHSHRWQVEASVPEVTFEAWIAKTKEANKELTSIGAYQLGRLSRPPTESPPMPEGIFDVIYADPPWPYDNKIISWGPAELHYPTLSLEALCEKGKEIPAAKDAVLFLWVTNPMIPEALEVVGAWGFEYKTNIVWIKSGLKRPGSGFYVRGRHELLFICTRGSFVPDQTGKEPIGSILEAPVGEHSQKPKEVYVLIERLYPGCKYLELFAREKREGWESWGNEFT